KYRVSLTDEQRTHLPELLPTGKAAARTLTPARLLLKADQGEGGAGWSDDALADALEVSLSTLHRVRQRFVAESLDAALHRPAHLLPRQGKLDGHQQAHLIALACGEPPEGRNRWSLRLLADRMVELGDVADVAHQLVRRTLKKTKSSPI